MIKRELSKSANFNLVNLLTYCFKNKIIAENLSDGGI